MFEVSLTATCQGICFVHPVPTSTSPPRTSTWTKAVTTRGKTSPEHKSYALSCKILDRVLILRYVDKQYPYGVRLLVLKLALCLVVSYNSQKHLKGYVCGFFQSVLYML